jgi:hypothetical protein
LIGKRGQEAWLRARANGKQGQQTQQAQRIHARRLHQFASRPTPPFPTERLNV